MVQPTQHFDVGDVNPFTKREFPDNRLVPNVHQCSRECIPTVTIDEPINPLLLPYSYGFLRHFLKMPTKKKDPNSNEFNIVYSTPCGKVLFSYGQIKSFLIATNFDKLDVDNFTFSVNFLFAKCKTYYVGYEDDIAGGSERWPIPLVNVFDEAVLSDEFKYTSSRLFHATLDIDTEQLSNYLSCCSCTNNCENFYECECQQLTHRESGNKNFGYRYKRLYHQHNFGIYECNDKCKCNQKCPNRVVQAGLKFQLQLFRIALKGWGVRSPHFIAKGTYITSYHGQVVDDKVIENTHIKDDYLAVLDLIDMAAFDKESVGDLETNRELRDEVDNRFLANKFLTKYLIDGGNWSNIGRFFNHSCDPNMFVQNVFIETHDLRFHHIAFFALRDITPFEELTWDYNFGYGGADSFVDCHCQSNTCRFRLF